jgi:hypothetical protein
VVATRDPRTRPKARTWSLIAPLPVPGTRRAAQQPALPPADLRAGVRRSGVRQWGEHGQKQVKQELGWAAFPVRADRASRRQWALVCGACTCCWWAERHAPTRDRATVAPARTGAAPAARRPHEAGAGAQWGARAAADLTRRAHGLLAAARQPTRAAPRLAAGAAAGARLA